MDEFASANPLAFSAPEKEINMLATDERPAVKTRAQRAVVTAPAFKFVIGTMASLCAVFFPPLLAALTARVPHDVTFVTRDFAALGSLFSAAVGVVVMIIEWRVPRTPRDTFMTTLGLPAILASALTTNENSAALQQATRTSDELANRLGSEVGVSIQSSRPVSGIESERRRGESAQVLVTRVEAQAEETQPAPPAAQRPTFGVRIDRPRYVIVLDRGETEQQAQIKAAALSKRPTLRGLRDAGVKVQVEKRFGGFLVVAAGGPRPKSEALLEAMHLKEVYGVTPVLLEVLAK